jgi:4-hydroxy-tetrahydrodipicolinate reductase
LVESLQPVISKSRVVTEHVAVDAGRVAGIHQTADLAVDGAKRVSMELQMFVGAPRPGDTVGVDGSPPVELKIPAGIPGDEGTASVVISSARSIGALGPGLRTMLEVPLVPSCSGS